MAVYKSTLTIEVQDDEPEENLNPIFTYQFVTINLELHLEIPLENVSRSTEVTTADFSNVEPSVQESQDSD